MSSRIGLEVEGLGSVNVNSFLFVASIFGADSGICLIADGQAMCGCGFHCLCAYGLSVCFIRLLLVLKCCAVF